MAKDVFPPKHIQEANKVIDEWSTWWEGDPSGLATFYSKDATRKAGKPGLLNRVGAFFWSTGNGTNTRENVSKEHVPLAAEIAQKSANLLFAEMPHISSGEHVTDKTALTPLQDVLKRLSDPGMHSTLREAAEHCAALGGVYLRVVWDQEVRDLPWLSMVHPSRAIPEWRWDSLRAVTFWEDIVCEEKRVVRLLERHESGRITYSLWEGNKEELGREIPFTDYAETAFLVDVVDEFGGVDTGTGRLTAVYVPNMKPNKVWADMPECRNFGRSDYAGIEPLMDNLDATWTGWQNERDLAKARIIVRDGLLDNLGRGQGAVFNVDRQIFTGLSLQPTEDKGDQIEFIQPDMRTDAFERLFEKTKEQCVTLAGYSAASFGQKADAIMTATEVNAREHQTLVTRDAKISYWKSPLENILRALVEVAAFMGAGSFDTSGISVVWPEAHTPSADEVAEQLMNLSNALAISTYRKVKMLNPTWDEREIEEEVTRIKGDAQDALPVPPTEEAPNGDPEEPASERDEVQE